MPHFTSDLPLKATLSTAFLKLKHRAPVWSARFSPDGQRVVTASEDRTARVWDAATGQPLTEPVLHKWIVISARFSPDGKRIVTASLDRTARVWDARTGRPLTEPLRHDDWVADAEFSPDGNWVVTASSDGTARVWELPPASVPVPDWILDLAEATVGQRLLDQEVPEAVSQAQFLSLKQQIAGKPAAEPDATWAKWFLADRLEHGTSLNSRATGRNHFERLVEENTVLALREALFSAPDDSVATARLAREILPRIQRNTRTRKKSQLFWPRGR